ncbi:uncharacterized protein MELLADRAFT_90268 [Melampsora larici-populina 98AG31]|uniref:Uncharacterized protein n=1 Tax=Melampsora larici-populina (strain 98AG31 / pathotype 3-4-7) TaxID=747676 RepID=F4RWB6_MELLP|nr:uncharacterized protein MELLADRAFT_90268 [Melampsora larici-populina 98AG31]EGG03256.1 hypothetical protein MELLADRAFT_90268 [Melampsora larici-populina 98AG31]
MLGPIRYDSIYVYRDILHQTNIQYITIYIYQIPKKTVVFGQFIWTRNQIV